MKTITQLASQFQPKLISLPLGDVADAIQKAQLELAKKAEADSNKCFGYFPAMRNDATIDTDLPACEAFAKLQPTLNANGKTLKFNFIRISLKKQEGKSPFHLDTDAATALTGDVTSISERLVWRLLINLSDAHPRSLGYLNANASTVQISNEGGYLHCTDDEVEQAAQQSIVIPPCTKTQVYAVLFCASRVLHTGQDDIHGHFVSGYGCEEIV